MYPAGTAPLVSTVYMTVIPAKVANVKQIAICTPPRRDTGDIDPHILAVANLLGVNEIYRVGGVQAIGAMAFGTKTIAKVDKIVGPGNAYVTEAKRQVYGFVDIDMVAGPSEVAIIADHTANADFVTCDLLAQTEHHGGIGYLITPSRKLVEIMKGRIDTGIIIQVKSVQEACEVANEIAAEHLEIMTEEPEKVQKSIRHAGASSSALIRRPSSGFTYQDRSTYCPRAGRPVIFRRSAHRHSSRARKSSAIPRRLSWRRRNMSRN